MIENKRATAPLEYSEAIRSTQQVIIAHQQEKLPAVEPIIARRGALRPALREQPQWHTGWGLLRELDEDETMTRVQYLVLIAIGAILITLCLAEVMRGEDPRSANKEALTKDLMNLALRAQVYYHLPASKGGGSGSFAGLTANAVGLAKLTPKATNSNGTFIILTAGTATTVVLRATGTQLGTDGNPLAIGMTVLPDSTSIAYYN